MTNSTPEASDPISTSPADSRDGDHRSPNGTQRWSGKKTAVVAALAIGFSSAGAVAAAAALPQTNVVNHGGGGPAGPGAGRPGFGGPGGGTGPAAEPG